MCAQCYFIFAVICSISYCDRQLEEPRYVLFRYRHTHQGVDAAPCVFVYCCPDRAHHKLRMIYASSKRVMVEACEAAALPLIKKVRAACCSGF